MEFAHYRVVEMFEPCVMAAHVVRGPAGAEFIAASRELSYQVAQSAVERITTGLCSKDGHHVVGCELPVREEPAGTLFIQENETRIVSRPGRADVHLGV